MLSQRKGIILQTSSLFFLLFFISLIIRKQSNSFQINLFISEQQSCYAVINKLNHREISPVGNMNDVPFEMIWRHVSAQINSVQYEIDLVNKR